jgi:hypothetical protein
MLAMMVQAGWGQILTFEFSALAGSEVSAASNTNNAGLTTSTITRGAGLTASGNGGRFNATNWAATSITNAVSGNDYMEFTITPNAGKQFSVSSIVVQWQRSATGNTQIALRSSVDSYASNLDSVKSVTDNTSTQSFTWTFTQSNRTTAVTYRLYSFAEAAGGSGGPGDGTGNDITVNGTVTDSVATPMIATTGTLSTLSTTYGTASTNTTFSVSGTNMKAGISVAPPVGFQVSTTSDFTANVASNPSSITVGATGTIASTPVYVRLLGTATVAGSPYSGNVVLTSTGATTVNVATAASSVTAAPLTITGLTGTNKVYNGNTAASVTGTAAYSGLVNGDNPAVAGSPSFSFATAAVGNSKAITASGYTSPTNYTVSQPTGLTANITPAPLTITANDVIKPSGETLSSPVVGSTAFMSSGLVNSETIGTVTITYGTGAAAGDAAATYTDQVTPSAATGGTFAAANYDITYEPGDLIVSASPVITVTGSPSALSTITGTASASTSVDVSGANLEANITATAPSTDFEVSNDDSTWGPTATFTESVGAASGTLYIRLSASAPVSTPSGDVVLTSTGATSQNVTVSGTVFKTEPTNHVTAFAAGTITTTNIPVTWTAASPAPDGYLIKASSSTITNHHHQPATST